MERVNLGDDLALSRIIYGTWRLGDDPDTSVKHVQAKIETCLAQGITTIDQADIYGGYSAEALLGAVFKAAPALRDQVEIITKCGIVGTFGRYADRRVKHYDTTPGHIERSIDLSLEAMNIERIDLLLIHRPDPLMDHRETGAALDRAVRSGKVRAVGVSNFRPHDFALLQSATKAQLLTNQIELSLLCHEPLVNGDVAFLLKRGIRPMAWSPLGGGRLPHAAGAPLAAKIDEVAARNGVEDTAVCVAWLLAHPAGILPIMGTNRLARIAGFGDAMKVEMDRQTWFELYEAALGREVA